MRIPDSKIQPYEEQIIGFSGERVDTTGYINLYTIFGEKGSLAKTIKILLEYMALNERGGELFKRDFRKLWRYNENQCWITEKEIKETKNQNCFKMISEKQSVVSSKQSVVYTS